ncbi:L-aspartate oxidase [bacterium]|nr:L-aspartate oxidase [bacterium]
MTIITTDFIIVGSGIAGLSAALALAPYGDVIIVTKGTVHQGSTEWAQGGIAAAMNSDDTPKHHYEDTIAAGDGLCNPSAVRILVEEGPIRVKELMELGARFDRDGDTFSFTQEAAHSRRRILHAGDATGREIEKTLGNTVRRKPNIRFLENTSVSKLLVEDNECQGCVILNNGTVNILVGRAVIIATGGCGQVFAYNTNPSVATGDGIALAYTAGATIQDMEFTQFHPTTLYTGDKRPISLFLISEAVRGEGGILRNIHGERFMPRYHPSAELAPRDAVARAVYDEMKITSSTHVFLDLGDIPFDLATRFPTIFKRCRESGIDLRHDFVPVAPAAHYFMGGISTDENGQTSIRRLYAAGEAASLGIHGANRLASNSLLDGLVFGHRAGITAAQETPKISWPHITHQPSPEPLSTNPKLLKSHIRDTMWHSVGIVRSQNLLDQAANFFDTLWPLMRCEAATETLLELQSLAIVGRLMVQFASTRTSSWGSHFRSDYPRKNPAHSGHLWINNSMDHPQLKTHFSTTLQTNTDFEL